MYFERKKEYFWSFENVHENYVYEILEKFHKRKLCFSFRKNCEKKYFFGVFRIKQKKENILGHLD